MGWQDAPLVEDEPSVSGKGWASAPEIADSPGAQHPMPTMGDVALNAVPKGIASIINTPNVINHLILKGAANLPGMDALPGVKKFLEEGAEKFAHNAPEHLMEMAGIVDPAKNPQTGPQRIVDAAIQGAVSAATPGGGLKAAAMGAASGATGKSAEEFMRPIVGGTAAHWIGIATGAIIPAAPLVAPTLRAMKPAPHSPLNTKTRMETLKEGQEIGLVAQPTSVRPSAANQVRESIAGPGKLNLDASLRNQRAATEAAKQDLGLPPQAELTPSTFTALKTEAAKPYRELERLTGGKGLLEQIQQKRADAAAYWRANGETPSPEIRNAAKKAEQDALHLEMSADQLAQQSGVKGLVNRIRGAREAFAKIYDVEAATNVGDGHVSAAVLGRMLDADRPLSGNLKTIGKFWNAFRPVTREGATLGTVASGTDAASTALLATTGASSSGSVLGALAGAAPGLRGWARNKSLSPEVQRSLLDMGGMQSLIDLRPKAARGLSRSALIGSALHNTQEESQ